MDSLEGLSPDPWLGEAIDATELDGELRHRVREIMAAIEGFGARFLFIERPDPEYRTIIARLVRRIVERSPGRPTPIHTAAHRRRARVVGDARWSHRRRPATAPDDIDAITFVDSTVVVAVGHQLGVARMGEPVTIATTLAEGTGKVTNIVRG